MIESFEDEPGEPLLTGSQVVELQRGPRLHVLNPYSKNYFWIDADAVGPVGEPPQRAAGPKPADQNCAEQLYDG